MVKEPYCTSLEYYMNNLIIGYIWVYHRIIGKTMK